MISKHYDVIVIGENFAGLIAASLLASRHYTVLLIRRAAGPGREEYIGTNLAGERPITPGVFSYPVPTAVIRELNMGRDLRQRYSPAAPLFQYVDPNHRLSLYSERTQLLLDMQREYGNRISPDEIGEYLDSLDVFSGLFDKLLVPELVLYPDGMRQKWDYSSRIKAFEKEMAEVVSPDRLHDSRTLALIAATAERLNSSLAEADEGFDERFSLRRTRDLLGELLIPTSEQRIDEMLYERFNRRGGEILEQTAFMEMEVGRGGYVLHDARLSYGCDSLVCAFDYFLLAELFSDRKTLSFIEKQHQCCFPSRVWIKLSAVAEREAIPEGMDYRLFDDDNGSLRLFLRDPLIKETSEVERIDVLETIPIEDYHPEGVEKIQRQTRRRLGELIPFLDDHLQRIYPERVPENARGRLGPEIAGRRFLYKVSGKDGLFRGVPYRLPAKNCYLAGPEVLPELGLEGDFLTGWNVCRDICRKHPKKDELS